MKLSVVIPAHNEEGCIESTLLDLATELSAARIDFELVVAEDHCTDGTLSILEGLKDKIPQLQVARNGRTPGFGMAVRAGLKLASGEAITIYMADASDSPRDVVRYFEMLKANAVDCVFGSRFMRDSTVSGYPRSKLIINRLANFFIQLLFGLRYNDVTNAFKMYRRSVLEGLKPYLSPHFNLTVELPLKAIIRGYSYEVIPISWTGRKAGVSKLRLKEMGSRYLFIVAYCLLEKWLVANDYFRPSKSGSEAA